MNDHDAMLDLVAVAALGALSRPDLRVVTAHLAVCEECRAEYEALRPAADAVGLIAEEPVDSLRSARMKKRILAAVDSAAPVRRSSTSGVVWAAGLAAAAAIVFALVTTVQDISLRGDLANAQRQNTALQSRVAEGQRNYENEHGMLADLGASDAKRYAVADGEVVARGKRVYFTLHSLPALPKGKVYQAWTLAKGAKTVAPSVTFVPDASGTAVILLPANASMLAAVAMSVEPEGGSKAPTSKPTFIQPLS